MPDPMVREVGSVQDTDGRTLRVGVDYDTVTIGEHRLYSTQAEEFAQLFVAACWEAARQGVPDG